MIRDTLAQYASAIKYGALAVLVLGGFVTGCQHGKSRQHAKDKAAIEAADARANAHAQQSAILAGTLQQIDAETAQREATAKAEALQAKEAAKRAEQAAARFKRELASIEGDIAKAKKNPGCRKALESPVCAALH